jgi:hypothetical protein
MTVAERGERRSRDRAEQCNAFIDWIHVHTVIDEVVLPHRGLPRKGGERVYSPLPEHIINGREVLQLIRVLSLSEYAHWRSNLIIGMVAAYDKSARVHAHSQILLLLGAARSRRSCHLRMVLLVF